jgi:hypothetical protein
VSRSQDIADLRGDARWLRIAAEIMRRRSARPRSFLLGVLCRVLENAAAGLERQADSLS